MRATTRTPFAQVLSGSGAFVGCMSDAVHCYGGKSGGTRQYSLPQPAPIQCMQLLAAHTSRPAKCLMLALANGAGGTVDTMCVHDALGSHAQPHI